MVAHQSVLPHEPTNRHEVLAILALNRPLHTYGICNARLLWEDSRWWVGHGVAAGLVAPADSTPFLYCLNKTSKPVVTLLNWLLEQNVLPNAFDFGVAPGSEAVFSECGYGLSRQRIINKMCGPTYPTSRVKGTRACRILQLSDLSAITDLLATDPNVGSLFNSHMIETNAYIGTFEDGQLVAMAGVHFLDENERLATIGNVVTHPDHRGRGLGRLVVDACITRLNSFAVEMVGLNVLATNVTAFNLYESLGLTLAGQQASGYAEREA